MVAKKKINEEFIKGLRRRMDSAQAGLESFRQNQMNRVKQYVGNHYSGDTSMGFVPVNLLNQAVNIYCRQLAARNPNVMISTLYDELKPTAKDFELVLNKVLREIRFKETAQKVLRNALLGIGVIKTGLNRSRTVEIEGVLHDVGQPFADVVSLDDFTFDILAKTWEQVQFAGHRLRLPLDQVRDCGLYDEKIVKMLRPSDKDLHTEQGNPRMGSIGFPSPESREDFFPMVDLWEIWIPPLSRVVTFPVEDLFHLPLRDVEYMGPERGPYHLLCFEEVPDNILPLPPAAQLEDMHELVNDLFRKLRNQAVRQKKITLYQRGDDAQNARINDSEDGDAIGVDGPNTAQEVALGGVDQQLLAFVVFVEQWYSKLAGNLDALGGLGPQADTLGQDQLITMSANRKAADMQDRFEDFCADVLRDIGWYIWYDPDCRVPFTKKIPYTDMELQDTWTPDRVEGDFYEQNIQLEPYSMQHQTPGGKLQSMMSLLQNLIPLLPAAQEQGIVLDFEALVDRLADLANLPELKEVLKAVEPQAYQPEAAKDQPKSSPVTQRNYTRRSIPGASNAGKADALVRLLSGSKIQGAEAASLLRPTG